MEGQNSIDYMERPVGVCTVCGTSVLNWRDRDPECGTCGGPMREVTDPIVKGHIVRVTVT